MAGAAPVAPDPHPPVARRRLVGADREHALPGGPHEGALHVSEQTQRAGASLLSGSAGGGTGSVGASKAFSERREPLIHPRDFALLGNCQAIVMSCDGRRSLDARRCYLKPDFLPVDRPYWRAREAGEL